MKGSCSNYHRTKGYGFLVPVNSADPTMPDVFCHCSDIEAVPIWKRKFLLPGLNVEFDVEYDADDIDQERPRAKHVRVVPPIVIARQIGAPKTGGTQS